MRQFINETPISEDKRDWKERLLKSVTGNTLRLDLMYVGGESISEIILGHVSDDALSPTVIEAYRLQYPELSQQTSFVHEVQKLAGDPNRLRGFFSGVKGKLLEVEYRDYLNHGHLPEGFIAELSAKANEPGVDIFIKDSHGHVHDLLQAKAYESLQGVKEQIENYPELNHIIIPYDQIEAAKGAGLGQFVESAPVTNHDLDNVVHGAINHADSIQGFHFPLIGFGLLAGEVAFCMWYGKPISLQQVMNRGTKMTLSALVGQGAYLLAHSVWISIPAALMTRILFERYSKAASFIEVLKDKRLRAAK